MRVKFKTREREGEVDLTSVRRGDIVRFLQPHHPSRSTSIDRDSFGTVEQLLPEGLSIVVPARRTHDGDIFIEMTEIELDREGCPRIALVFDERDPRVLHKTSGRVDPLRLMRWAAREEDVPVTERGDLIHALFAFANTLADDESIAAVLEVADKLETLSDETWQRDLEDIEAAESETIGVAANRRVYAAGPLGIREMREWLRRPEEFVVVSAYHNHGTKHENQARHGELMADISRLGYSSKDVRPLRGKYFRQKKDKETKEPIFDEHGEPVMEEVAEQSVLVFGMSYEEGLNLARKYTQESFIHKSPAGVVGAYYTSPAGQVTLALDQGKLALGEAAAKVEQRRPKPEPQGRPHPDDPWSKGRSVGFEFPIDWGKKFTHNPEQPISVEDAEEQLFSRQAAPADDAETSPIRLEHYSPKPGLTQLDPAQLGSGALSRVERQDTRVPVSFYYFHGTRPEVLILSTSRSRYETELPRGARLLDLSRAPEGELRGAQAAYKHDGRGGMYQYIKDLGYFGFYDSEGALPNAVVVFYALPVTEVGLSRESNLVPWRRVGELTQSQMEDMILQVFEAWCRSEAHEDEGAGEETADGQPSALDDRSLGRTQTRAYD